MKRVFILMALFSVLVVGFSAPAAARGGGGGRGGGGHGGGGGGSHYGRFSGGSRYSSGAVAHYAVFSPSGYRGGYSRYYYRGSVPRGAIVGSFFGGMVVGGISSPFWWPFYAVPVPVGYYDPYYAYPSYAAPQYVLVVPPPDATTAQSEPVPATPSPNQCYAPKVDQSGNLIYENNDMIPDFSKPVPCPPQSQ